jgi:hypothetical protein
MHNYAPSVSRTWLEAGPVLANRLRIMVYSTGGRQACDRVAVFRAAKSKSLLAGS